MTMVDLTVAVFFSAGSAGEKEAVPAIVLQVGLAAAAPLGEAINPSGSNIAAATNIPATLRILQFPSGQ